jgi:peptidoglycan/LPS O-acetylase OafA/YrhL
MGNHQSPAFFGYLHSFRGFAIINIAAIHVFGFSIFSMPGADFNKISYPNIVNEILFHNSTIYFAVISGILFTLILKQKGYKSFYLNKIKYVLFPYIFLTLIFSIFDNQAQGFFVPYKEWSLYFKNLISNFIYGRAIFVFWYMPVLFFLYLITPLLDYVLNKLKGGKWIMWLIILTPLVVRRIELMEPGSLDSLQLKTMIYFTGAYAAGMYFASNIETNLQWINRNKWLLIILTVILSIGLFYAAYNKIDRFGFFSLMSTLYYIQKIVLTGLALLFFKTLGQMQPRWLRLVADHSFTIYFLHVFFLIVLIGPFSALFQYQKIYPFNGILSALLLLFLTIALCIVTAVVFKKIFGKYSRMFVGS